LGRGRGKIGNGAAKPASKKPPSQGNGADFFLLAVTRLADLFAALLDDTFFIEPLRVIFFAVALLIVFFLAPDFLAVTLFVAPFLETTFLVAVFFAAGISFPQNTIAF
jgi:hypothetical protein